MAFRRKSFRRRRAPVRRLRFRRKRFVRRRRFTRRRGDSLLLKVRSIRDIVLTDAVPNYSEVTGWSLNDFTAGSEITAAQGLFMEFKINMVVVRFIPKNNVADANAVCFNQSTGLTFQANWQAGQVYTVIDYDSSSAMTAEADALQYTSMRVTPTWRPWTRIIRPKLKLVGLSDSSTTNSVFLTNGWLPCSAVGEATLYRGFKMMFQDCKGSDPGTLPDFRVGRILTTMYVAFRKRK